MRGASAHIRYRHSIRRHFEMQRAADGAVGALVGSSLLFLCLHDDDHFLLIAIRALKRLGFLFMVF